LVGKTGAEAIQAMIASASQPKAGLIATVISIVTLLFGASGVFGALQDALNTIWEVTPKPGRGVLGAIRDRFVSFTMLLGVAFLLLVALVLSAGLAALGKFVGGLLPVPEVVLQLVNLIISFGVITLLFAMIYRILPDVEIRWSDVWIGAAVTALLFTIGKFALGLYLGKGSVGSAYGAAGSLLVVLLWVYYSAQILFFGAEFTQVYANTYGSRVVPSSNAVPLTEEAQAEQGMPRRETVEAAQARAETDTRPARAETAARPAPRGEAAQGQPASARSANQRVYRYYGVAVGAAWLSFVAGLLVGTVSVLVGLVVGVVRRVRS
jgi:membrane protein